VAVFQPHLYSRTRQLWPEFGRALAVADRVVVTDVFAAREAPEPGVSGQLIVDGVHQAAPTLPVVYEPDRGALALRAVEVAEPGDLVLTMGAGDITTLAAEIAHVLEDA
jgi:UDP-N-acetylmuramate--alanine ligase